MSSFVLFVSVYVVLRVLLPLSPEPKSGERRTDNSGLRLPFDQKPSAERTCTSTSIQVCPPYGFCAPRGHRRLSSSLFSSLRGELSKMPAIQGRVLRRLCRQNTQYSAAWGTTVVVSCFPCFSLIFFLPGPSVVRPDLLRHTRVQLHCSTAGGRRQDQGCCFCRSHQTFIPWASNAKRTGLLLPVACKPADLGDRVLEAGCWVSGSRFLAEPAQRP